MLPLVALVGRPNVGKSTLFNGLTRTRDALVHDEPGVTRDRNYGICRLEETRPFAVCDTGGLSGDDTGQWQRGHQPEQATTRRLGGEGARKTIEGESIHRGSLAVPAIAPGTHR